MKKKRPAYRAFTVRSLKPVPQISSEAPLGNGTNCPKRTPSVFWTISRAEMSFGTVTVISTLTHSGMNKAPELLATADFSQSNVTMLERTFPGVSQPAFLRADSVKNPSTLQRPEPSRARKAASLEDPSRTPEDSWLRSAKRSGVGNLVASNQSGERSDPRRKP
jgi:hypothetical protein